MPANVSNGSCVQGNERAQVIHYLAEGFSVRYVANRFKRSEHTIAAIRDIESRTIAERKPALAAQAERNAMLAADVVQDDLRADKLHGVQAATVFGIMIDKALLLRGESSLNVRHDVHVHADDKLLDAMLQANARAEKRVKFARVVEHDQPQPHTLALPPSHNDHSTSSQTDLSAGARAPKKPRSRQSGARKKSASER